MINFKKLIASFGHAFEGWMLIFRRDQNIRSHSLIAILVIAASIYFQIDPFEMAILMLTITMVLVAEFANTAIEQMVDLIVKEHMQEAKFVKDVAAGMVLVSAIGSIAVGILIFLPKLLEFFLK